MADPDPMQPYGDAMPPALLAHRQQRPQFATEVYLPPSAASILLAWRHYDDRELFDRYLRLVHGTSTIEHADDHDTTMLIFDTADCLAHIGTTASVDLSGARAEWQAWLDGEVYGVLIEHRHPSGAWTCADSLWGLFGGDYTQQQAQQMLLDCAAV